jgi:hypothetical protein
MKTYSLAIKVHKETVNEGKPYWITNWHQYNNLEDIDWNEVKQFVLNNPQYIAYGYYYGNNSRKLTSDKCRTVLFEK